jgi:uncharacterized protein YkwD
MDRRQFVGYGSVLAAASLVSVAPLRAVATVEIPLAGAIRRFADARRAAGLAVPRPDPALTASARRQVLRMAEQGAASHFGDAGEAPDARATAAGFRGRVLGEALAETREGPEETMEFWLSHEVTRDVLMDRGADRFGLAAVTGPDGRAWWLLATGA